MSAPGEVWVDSPPGYHGHAAVLIQGLVTRRVGCYIFIIKLWLIKKHFLFKCKTMKGLFVMQNVVLSVLVVALVGGCGQLPGVQVARGPQGVIAVRSLNLDHSLIEAAGKGRTGDVQSLLSRGARIDARNGNGYTALALAAWRGHGATVKVLLDAGANPNLANEDRKTPLHWAAAFGHAAIVSGLVAAQASLNPRDDQGWTPLAWAAFNNRIPAAQALIASGADVNARTTSGVSVLELARRGGMLPRHEMQRLLEKAGARL
jgi:hypothetical protein